VVPTTGIEVSGWWEASTSKVVDKRQHQTFYLRSSKIRPLLDKDDIKAKVANIEKGSKWSLTSAQREERYQSFADEALANHIFNRIRIVDESKISHSISNSRIVDVENIDNNNNRKAPEVLESLVFLKAVGDGIADELIEKPIRLASAVDSLMTEKHKQEHLVVKSPSNPR
jgi:hypothetical protein